MEAALDGPLSTPEQDREIELTVRRERPRLLAFIRRRIADATEAEDVLQETLYELVLAYRLLQPIEQAGAWLAQVARNRIIDRFRRRALQKPAQAAAEEAAELLPATNEGPEAVTLRAALLEQLATALARLPAEQRAVFVAHELAGESFKEMAARTGVSVNTLLARKHYATRALRKQLQSVWDDWLTG
jgi:RNA polymerase sigma factor (sigma-70 family)